MPHTPLNNETDRYVPDKNPTLPCNWCGRTERWQDIKESGDWFYSNDPDVPFLCPDCKEEYTDGSE